MKKIKVYDELILQAKPDEIGFEKVSEISRDYTGPFAKCAYLPGDDEIEIHSYSVFIRNHDNPSEEGWNTSNGMVAIEGGIATLLKTGVDWWASSIVAGKFAAPATECGDWGIIGRLEEKPTVKTSDGQTIKLEDCNEVGLSDIVEVNLNHLQVNGGNWRQLRAMAKTGNVDILFVEYNKLAADSPIDGPAVSNIKIRVNIEITGNDKNSMPITAKKELGDATACFDLIDVSGSTS